MSGFRTKKKTNASYAWYKIIKGEACGTVAGANSLIVNKLKKFNSAMENRRLEATQSCCYTSNRPIYPVFKANQRRRRLFNVLPRTTTGLRNEDAKHEEEKK